MNPAFIPTRRPPTTRLTYTITASSEHSHRYVPENILVNAPDDQSSRWSGVHEGSNVKQWLLLRLDSPSVVGLYLIADYLTLVGRYSHISIHRREYHIWEGE